MRLLNYAFLAFLFVSGVASASAQAAAVDPMSILLDEQIQKVVGEHGTHSIIGNSLILALFESESNEKTVTAEMSTAQLRAAINRQRTDVQVSATSDSPHATSILEKPGIADILSLAIDRGAIKKTVTGTGLTLSTTPYAIWTGFGARDTPQLWEKAVVARKLSFSATFSSTDVTAGDFSSLTSGEVKYIITGNRSPRDEALLKGIRSNLGKIFRAADHSTDEACNSLLNTKNLIDAQGNMNTWLRGNIDATEAEIRVHLDSEVRQLTVDRKQLRACVDTILQGEQSIRGGLDSVTEATKQYLAEHPRQFSVAALFVRDTMISDYYTAKLLYGYDYQPLTVNLNAEASWNKNSVTAAGVPINALRAYSVELGVNSRTFANGRLDGALSGKASRDKAADAKSVVVSEAKLNVHLTDVLRLPLTLSYANRETQTVKQGWQFNIGINALLDDVLSRLK